MSIGRLLSELVAPRVMSGRRLEYYRSELELIDSAVSRHPLALTHLSGRGVTHLGRPVLGSRIEIGGFNLSGLDFCRLFIVFNGSSSSEFQNESVSKLGTPRGIYVLSESPGLTSKQVRVGLFSDSLLDLVGKSLFLDHLMLKKDVSPPLLGTIAVTLSLLTAYKAGVTSVKLLAAGGYDSYHHYRHGAEYIGFMVFPKFGFDAPLSNKERRNPRLAGYRSVQDVISQDPDLWEEVGFQRFMKFDMRPNSQSWNRLLTYLRRKGIY